MEQEKKPLIFVVDDEPVYVSVLKQSLNANNYENIRTFHSGEECLACIEEQPDVILLDFHMDGINGIEVMQKVKEYNPYIPIVFLSKDESVDLAIKSIKNGATSYIVKNKNAFNQVHKALCKAINYWC